MGKNPIVAIVAVIVIVVAVVLMFRGGNKTPSSSVPQANWYDTGTNELYGVTPTGNDFPPMPATSGQDGVIAYVFSCTSCTDKSSRFIGYLEKYTAEDKAALADRSGPPGERHAIINNSQVRGEQDTEWVVKSSAEGQSISTSADAQCAPQQASACHEYMP